MIRGLLSIGFCLFLGIGMTVMLFTSGFDWATFWLALLFLLVGVVGIRTKLKGKSNQDEV